MKSGLRELVLALVISLCALPASTLVVAAEPAGATARTVLVIGATGRTGREVVVKSLEAGYRVRAARIGSAVDNFFTEKIFNAFNSRCAKYL